MSSVTFPPEILVTCALGTATYILRGPPPTHPTITNVIQEMPVNAHPDRPPSGGWWQRTVDQITGITVHHTLSHAPYAMAEWITRPKARNGKGYPTTQYTYWVTKEGDILLCVPLAEGLWHDHCGDMNTHISIGMAGILHITKPPPEQVRAVGLLVRWLCDELDIAITEVRGHNEWAWTCSRVRTVCPGWDENAAGWKEEFYAAIPDDPPWSPSREELLGEV